MPIEPVHFSAYGTHQDMAPLLILTFKNKFQQLILLNRFTPRSLGEGGGMGDFGGGCVWGKGWVSVKCFYLDGQ